MVAPRGIADVAMTQEDDVTGVAVPTKVNYLHQIGNARSSGGSFPRLLYLGDVPVESTYHGSALIYRLLQGYPPERLVVVEQNPQPSMPERKLPNVRYEQMHPLGIHGATTRLHRLAALWLLLTAARRVDQVQRSLRDFQPDAVLTVAHGYSWLTAAAFARRKNLPLHLIVHDDWPHLAAVWGMGSQWLVRRLGAIYRQATSRFCVSPSMVEVYKTRYGVEGTLLYPSRAVESSDDPLVSLGNAPREEEHSSVTLDVPRPLTGAFAGTANSQGYFDALAALARQLDSFGGKLIVFGPIDKSAIKQFLPMPNIEFRGLLPSNCLIAACRQECDFLFVPMSFGIDERPNMELSFPSKLADYSAMAKPLLIRGPSYCSAVRWARENPGVAIVVDSENEEALFDAIVLLSNAEARRDLAVRAKRVGDLHFSHARAQNTLLGALVSKQHPGAVGP